MADDRMKDDDLQRNMGNKEGQDYGKQTPGRTGHGQQKDARNLEDDEEFGAGGAGQTGGQNRGGQNR